jgi:hypothetical protein
MPSVDIILPFETYPANINDIMIEMTCPKGVQYSNIKAS